MRVIGPCFVCIHVFCSDVPLRARTKTPRRERDTNSVYHSRCETMMTGQLSSPKVSQALNSSSFRKATATVSRRLSSFKGRVITSVSYLKWIVIPLFGRKAEEEGRIDNLRGTELLENVELSISAG